MRRLLKGALEADGIRLLELHFATPSRPQLYVSTKPFVAPSDVARLVKGRWYYLLRDRFPKLWQRHYSISSVGEAKCDVLQNYLSRQLEHHRVSDERAINLLTEFSVHQPKIDLKTLRSSGHSKYSHNLQIVFENDGRLADIRPESLALTQSMFLAACLKKGWLLARLALVTNHLHSLIGCGINDNPRTVALSLMNNVAFAHGMKPLFASSYYVGTFGAYDHGAILNSLAEQQPP